MTFIPKKNITRDFDRAAKHYDEHAVVQRKAADYLFSIIKDSIDSNKMVLDAGCGTGYFHELLRKNKIYCPLIQADISYNMCKISDGYSSSGKFGSTYTVQSDIERLPIAASSIDFIFSSLTVQWTDISTVLNQFYSILKPNSRLAIATLGSDTLFELKETSSLLDKGVQLNNFIEETALKEEFVKAGFNNVKLNVKTIKIEHDNLKKLFLSIKGVGAGYKSERSVKYLGKDYFIRLEDKYRESFSADNKLIASWNIVYITADK
jgi:malonyl-CoA O-methyltransferase